MEKQFWMHKLAVRQILPGATNWLGGEKQGRAAVSQYGNDNVIIFRGNGGTHVFYNMNTGKLKPATTKIRTTIATKTLTTTLELNSIPH